MDIAVHCNFLVQSEPFCCIQKRWYLGLGLIEYLVLCERFEANVAIVTSCKASERTSIGTKVAHDPVSRRPYWVRSSQYSLVSTRYAVRRPSQRWSANWIYTSQRCTAAAADRPAGVNRYAALYQFSTDVSYNDASVCRRCRCKSRNRSRAGTAVCSRHLRHFGLFQGCLIDLTPGNHHQHHLLFQSQPNLPRTWNGAEARSIFPVSVFSIPAVFVLRRLEFFW